MVVQQPASPEGERSGDSPVRSGLGLCGADLQRIIVDQLATRPEVGHAQTYLIFDHPLTASVRPRPESSPTHRST